MINHLVGGFNPSEKKMKVSWDYEIPIYGKIKNVPNQQPAITMPLLSHYPIIIPLFTSIIIAYHFIDQQH